MSPSKLAFSPVLRGLDLQRRARIALVTELEAIDEAVNAGKSLTREGKAEIMEAITNMRRMVIDAEKEATVLAGEADETGMVGMLPSIATIAPLTPTPVDVQEMVRQAVQSEMRPILEAIKDLGSHPRVPEPVEETALAALQRELQDLREEVRDLREAVLDEAMAPRDDLASATLNTNLLAPEYPFPYRDPEEFSAFATKLRRERIRVGDDRMLKSPVIPPYPIKIPRPTLLVTVNTKDPITDPKLAIQKWKKAVSFRHSGFGPERIVPLEQNRFKVEFKAREMVHKAAKGANKVPEIVATPAKRKLPLMILKGIPKEIPETDLVGTLEGQNPISGLRLCYLVANKKEGLYNAVLEVQPEVRRYIIAQGGRLSVGHGKVHVSDQTRFVQCFACLKYGHTKRKCTATRRPCSYCAEPNHQYSECPYAKTEPEEDQKHIFCINCEDVQGLETYHSATDRTRCPELIKAMAKADANTIYDDPPPLPEPLLSNIRTPSALSLLS